MLSAYYKQQNKTGAENDWAIQLMASGGGKTDAQNYVGVMPDAKSAALAGVYEPPVAAGGYVAVAVRKSNAGNASTATNDSRNATMSNGSGGSDWLAASFAEPIGGAALGRAWEVLVVSDMAGPITLSWDNVSTLPHGYESYLIGGPAGPVNLRQSSSVVLFIATADATVGARHAVPLQLAVGTPEFVAPFLAPPFSKENAFVYPNPGPDGATQMMTFKWGPTATGDVKLKIVDVSGRLVKELSADATAQKIEWDTTNKHGQKVGSGVYIYILESGGEKLVDKLAIIR